MLRVQEFLDFLDVHGLLFIVELPAEGVVWRPLRDELSAALPSRGLSWGSRSLTLDRYEHTPYIILRPSSRTNQDAAVTRNIRSDVRGSATIITSAYLHNIHRDGKVLNPYEDGKYSNLPLLFLGMLDP